MSQQNVPNLGRLIDGDARRDAVHIAVAPVTAGQELRPGERVGFLADGRVGAVGETIGIIDPFLTASVREGERCWLFLYPNTITSLRHVWTHPSFVAKPPGRNSNGT